MQTSSLPEESTPTSTAPPTPVSPAFPPAYTPQHSEPQSLLHPDSLWTAFKSILTFIALAFFAGSIHTLWGLFIDQWIARDYGYSLDKIGIINGTPSYVPEISRISSYALNGAIAALLVSAPIFIFLFYLTNKEYVANPELKHNRARTTLSYFTLVVTFIFIDHLDDWGIG